MRMDKLTNAFQMALADAQSLALSHDHAMIEPQHVMQALLQDEAGTLASILTQSNVNLPALKTQLSEAIQRLPKVEGTPGEVHISNELNRVFNVMEKLAQKRKDQYISSELFLLAVLESNGTVSDILRNAGANKTVLEKAIDSERGGERVEEQGAESQRNALAKYTIDLTAQALKGKLDPVIGRDAEIRRTIQVLQRRTKNNPLLI